MRAVLVNAYSYRNAGDAAIMVSTAALLRDLGHRDIVLATRYVEDADDYAAHGMSVAPPLIAFATRGNGTIRRAIPMVVQGIVAIALLSLPSRLRLQRGPLELLHRLVPGTSVLSPTDTAVIAGGGYLYSSRRRVNLSMIHSLLTMWVCRRITSNVIVMPNSIGPVDRRFDRVMIEAACRQLVMVPRELRSLAAGRQRPKVHLSSPRPDIAFYAPRPDVKSSATEHVVRLVAMDWGWSRSVNAERMPEYLHGMAEIADRLYDRGFAVELGGHSAIPEHGQDDLVVCESIAALAKRPVKVDRDADVTHLWRRYGEVRCVVATRLHACIMAASVGTPAVALGYQEKAAGVMETARVPVPVFPVDCFDPAIVVDACLSAMSAAELDRLDQARRMARNLIRMTYTDE
jgi:polysaccharide pyruvyl transferase WcaK-like protein